MVEIKRVGSDAEIQGILDLQQANLKRNLSAEAIASQGFVTLEHDFGQLKRMHDAAPSVIIKDGNAVVGYAIVMLPAFKTDVPKLAGLFDIIDQKTYDGKKVGEYNYVVVGQVCVGAGYRGMGLFSKMYAFYRRELEAGFDMCLTDISSNNPRSRKAHERIGFQLVSSFFDVHAQETWELIVWDWR